MNVLTVGATQEGGSLFTFQGMTDTTFIGAPALYSANGPGIGRSIKPDVFYRGGRQVVRMDLIPGCEPVYRQNQLFDKQLPSGIQVAAPDRPGQLNATSFTYGTSVATALVTRLADGLWQRIEDSIINSEDSLLSNDLFHSLAVRALIVHSAHHSSWPKQFRDAFLGLDNRNESDLKTLFGYGPIDESVFNLNEGNRAIVIGAGEITQQRTHTFNLPLPASLHAKAEWHRVTLTLAYNAYTNCRYRDYRGRKVKVSISEKKDAWKKNGANYFASGRGSVQQVTIENAKALVIEGGATLPIEVSSTKTPKWQDSTPIPYVLIASIETKPSTSATIYDEVRQGLTTQMRARQVRAQDRG